jgi:hypothetical protein
LQPLHFGARIADLVVHFVEAASLRRQLVFARFDFRVGFAFRLLKPRDLRLRVFELRFQLVELRAGVMSVEHL